MNANQNVKSSIERQLSSVNVSEEVRRQVLHDARIAELIVDAILWAGNKFERFGGRVFARLSPKC